MLLLRDRLLEVQDQVRDRGAGRQNLFNHQGHIPGALATWYLLTERWTIPRVAESAAEGEKLYDMAGRAPEQHVHTCRFNGNTLVEIAPPLMAGSPLYQRRQGFLSNEAPMRKVTRFTSALTLHW